MVSRSAGRRMGMPALLIDHVEPGRSSSQMRRPSSAAAVGSARSAAQDLDDGAGPVQSASTSSSRSARRGHQGHRVTLGGEQPGRGRADPRRGAGDQDDPFPRPGGARLSHDRPRPLGPGVSPVRPGVEVIGGDQALPARRGRVEPPVLLGDVGRQPLRQQVVPLQRRQLALVLLDGVASGPGPAAPVPPPASARGRSGTAWTPATPAGRAGVCSRRPRSRTTAARPPSSPRAARTRRPASWVRTWSGLARPMGRNTAVGAGRGDGVLQDRRHRVGGGPLARGPGTGGRGSRATPVWPCMDVHGRPVLVPAGGHHVVAGPEAPGRVPVGHLVGIGGPAGRPGR